MQTNWEILASTPSISELSPPSLNLNENTIQLKLVFQKEDLALAAATTVVETILLHVIVACEHGENQQEPKEKIKQEGSDTTLEEHVI